MWYRRTERSLAISILLISLMIHTASAQSRSPEWGPGAIGECVELDFRSIRCSTYNDSVNVVVVANSLYHRIHLRHCYTKVLDFPFDILRIDEDSHYPVTFLTFTSERGDLYRYDLESGRYLSYTAIGLLDRFLDHPIRTVSITDGWSACMMGSPVGSEGGLEYSVAPVDTPLVSLRYENPVSLQRRSGQEQIDRLVTEELTRGLQQINSEPHRVPSLAEFTIGGDDERRYAERVRKEVEDPEPDDQSRVRQVKGFTPTARTMEFYLQAISSFDTVGPYTLLHALSMQQEIEKSRILDYVDVDIVNEAGDSIRVICRNACSPLPYRLPWTIQTSDDEFQVYNVRLARALINLLPEREWRLNSEEDEDCRLMIVVAGYLEQLSRQKE